LKKLFLLLYKQDAYGRMQAEFLIIVMRFDIL